MNKELVTSYRNILKISTLRDYWLLKKYKNITSANILLNWWCMWTIFERDWDSWYLKVFVNWNDIIFNRLDTRNYWFVIHLITTKCNYWWKRWWFICPWTWKKCSNLYFHSSWRFYSRKYLNLSYPEQKLSKKQRNFEVVMWKYNDKADEIKWQIKYKTRLWLKTRKQTKLEYFESKSVWVWVLENYVMKELTKIKIKMIKKQ